MLDQRAQPLLIFSGEAPVSRTIDIQHADNLAIHAQREDNFRITGGIAGNVAVKGVDVLDALDLSLRHRRAAYASPDRIRTQASLPLNGPNTRVSPSRR